MNDRLNALLRDKGLSPTGLAKLLNIQPSSVSHLLSGRNKPGYNFIVKLLEAFPDVDSRWLLTGKGRMYNAESSPYNRNIAPSEPPAFRSDSFSAKATAAAGLAKEGSDVQGAESFEAAHSGAEETEFIGAADAEADKATAGSRADGKAEAALPPAAQPEEKPEPATGSQGNGNSSAGSSDEPQARKIVVIYSDRTFDIFSQR